eukprot:907683-Amphidinium_carterae.1
MLAEAISQGCAIDFAARLIFRAPFKAPWRSTSCYGPSKSKSPHTLEIIKPATPCSSTSMHYRFCERRKSVHLCICKFEELR